MMIASTEQRVRFDDGASTILDAWGESGPVIVCVHGISSSRKSWERFAQHAGASYRIFAYDQRGHGDSARVTGPMTLERSYADLAAVIETIGEPVHALIGHSWGGAVVLGGGRRVAAARVVAIDPMIRQLPNMWATDFVDDLRPTLALPPDQREAAIRELYADLPPVEIEAKVHAMREMSIEPIVALGAQNHADSGDWDLRETVLGYPKPLLLLLADPGESVVQLEDVDLIERDGGPNIRVETFAGEGHSLQRTAFDRFAVMTGEFLAR